MSFLIMYLNECFECGNSVDEMHHVVPRSRGGKKTIPLCNLCHGKAHGIGGRNGHSNLIKEGIIKSPKKGGRSKIDDELILSINKLKFEGKSNRAIGKLLKISHSTVGIYV